MTPMTQAQRENHVNPNNFVWIVDECSDTSRATQEILTSEGYPVESFDSIAAVRARLAEPQNGSRVMLAIVDLDLPDGSGPAFSLLLKERFPHIGILYLTARRPRPLIQGARVLSKPIKDEKEFLGLVWSHTRASSVEHGFLRLEQRFDEYSDEARATTAKVEEAILACSASIREIRGNCIVHSNTINAQIESLTLPTVLTRWWSKQDAVVKWLLGLGASVIVSVGGFMLTVGTLAAREAASRLQHVAEAQVRVDQETASRTQHLTSVQAKIDREIEPALREIQRQTVVLARDQEHVKTSLTEVLKRLPPSPETPVPGWSGASPAPAPYPRTTTHPRIR